jgi:acyl carrier protein
MRSVVKVPDNEKIALLEEMLDLDNGTLKVETKLDAINNWDSMAVISLIALFDEYAGETITITQIKELVTIKDILDLWNSAMGSND